MLNILLLASQLIAIGAGIGTSLTSYELTKSPSLRQASIFRDEQELKVEALKESLLRKQAMNAISPEVMSDEDIKKYQVQLEQEKNKFAILKEKATGDIRRKAVCAGIGIVVWGVLKQRLDSVADAYLSR